MKHQVIIPQFLHKESNRDYIPQTLKIQKGDTITWINTDNESHYLYFIKIERLLFYRYVCPLWELYVSTLRSPNSRL